ncbi:MAG: PLP-dependent aminotransferase family protein [Gammaproteobacteria bacterium]|nr:PLP-dependent aminotransferase family protein [Gammaproteobacteria bacterium]
MNDSLGQGAWQSLLGINHAGGIGLQLQLRTALSAAIADGRVSCLTPLPSSRSLSRMLAISRTTVSLAYQQLVDDGYLVSRERQGYFVNPEMTASVTSAGEGAECRLKSEIDWGRRLKIPIRGQRNIRKPHDWRRYPFPFIYGQRDPTLLAISAWRECWREAQSVRSIANAGCDMLDQDDSGLVEHLRSRVLPRRGVWAKPENILITLGAQNALALLARLLIDRSHVVGVEDPGYPDARNMFQLESDHVVPLQIDQDGLIVDDAVTACDYVFVTPNLQSPTGVKLSQERRRALLEAAASHDIIIIEDDYASEGALGDQGMPALKSEDEAGRVLYCGSLSKSLGPGLRLGYLVADAEIIEQTRALRRLMVRHPPPLIQHAVALFIEYGHYDSYVKRLSTAYRERWQVMTGALGAHLPDFSPPSKFSGSACWIEGPDWLNADLLAVEAANKGVLIEPGSVHYAGPDIPYANFRLGFAATEAETIEKGVATLAKVVDQLRPSRRAVRAAS